MSKGGGDTVRTTKDTSPWDPQQSYLKSLFSRAEGLYGQPTVAPQSPYTLQAIQARAGAGAPGSLIGQAQDLYGKTIRGDYLDLSKNPSAQYAMDAARSKINSQFGGDQYGDSAHREWLNRGLMEAASPFYQAERANQMNAATAAPSMSEAGLGQLQQAGQMQDVYQQRLTDSPWEALQRYQSAIGGQYGGTSTGQEPYNRGNPLMDLAGLAMAGKYVFSDLRLKRDIECIGTHRIGVPLYRFRYLQDEIPRIGVMAQELMEVMPQAVGARDGYLTVNYAMLEQRRG